MDKQRRHLSTLLTAALLTGLIFGVTGCGYFKNLRDDTMDGFIAGAGVVTPVAKGKEDTTTAVGLLPPSLGLYLQATDFVHLGALYKISGDVELDRRGTWAGVDYRAKAGIGPFHYISFA